MTIEPAGTLLIKSWEKLVDEGKIKMPDAKQPSQAAKDLAEKLINFLVDEDHEMHPDDQRAVVMQIQQDLTAHVNARLEEAIPTNWCDKICELLTEPEAIRGPLNCLATEKLLLVIIERIRALKEPTAKEETK